MLNKLDNLIDDLDLAVQVKEELKNFCRKLDDLDKEIFIRHFLFGDGLRKIARDINSSWQKVQKRRDRLIKNLNKHCSHPYKMINKLKFNLVNKLHYSLPKRR